ncbi:MAG: phage major capsid protein [Melioribacteraceae bacterium]
MKPKIEGLEPDKLNPRNFGGMCSRSAVVHRAESKREDGGIATVATTEAPAVVIDWERWDHVREILPMRYCDLPKNNKTILLDAHSRMSVENVLGSARNWKTNESELLCDIYVSDAEEDVKKKIEEGHIDSVSIGYQTDPLRTVEIPKGAAVTIDGVEYKNEFNDDMPLLVRTFWKVKELSLVPIGADEAAKLKRNAAQNGISSTDPELQKQLNEAVNQIKSLETKLNSIKIHKEEPMEEPTKKTQDQLRLEAINEIKTAVANYGKEAKEHAEKTINEILQGKEITDSTLKEFYKSVTDIVIKSGGTANKPVSYMGLNENELKGYSPTKAVQALLRGETKGYEFEISDDIQKRTGLELGKGEIFVPADYSNIGLRHLAKRAHSYGVAAEGGYLSTPDFRADLLKDVIMNETVLGRLGATVITGLRGQFQMPKIVSGLSHYGVAENAAATSTSYIVTGLDTVEPKHLAGDTQFGRLLFMMLDPALGGFDTILMNQLIKSRNVKLDYLGINGTGVGIQPKGILNQSGPAAPSLAQVNFKNLVNIKRLIAKANGLKENMKFGTSVDVESVFEVTPKEAGQPYGYLLQDGKVIGYGYESSNQIPDKVAIFGLWPEFFLLNWGVEKLTVADQPQHKNDVIEISLHSYFNFFLRSSESFAIASDTTVDIFGA